MRKSDSEGASVTPPNIGWLEKKLSPNEVDYLWDCINDRGKSYKKTWKHGNTISLIGSMNIHFHPCVMNMNANSNL